MADPSFDPYLKWFGIRTKEVPPDHYRLLGIERFEEDSDIIANAADSRMISVKTFQSGPHSVLSQRILNEVAAAKVCLLNRDKKAEYDRQLRERDAAAQQEVTPPPLPEPEPESELEPLTEFQPLPVRRASNLDRMLPAMIAVAAVAVVVLGIALFMLWPRGGDPVAVERPTDAPVRQSPVEDRPAGETQGSQSKDPEHRPAIEPDDRPPAPAPKRSDPPPSTKTAPPAKPEPKPPEVVKVEPKPEPEVPEEKPAPPETMDPENPIVQPENPVVPPRRVPVTPIERPAVKRLPVPSEDDQKSLERALRSDRAGDLAKAKNPETKLRLAETLFADALKGQHDPAARYVQLRVACEMMAAAGEIVPTLNAVDEVARLYDVDPTAMKIDVLSKGVETGKNLPGAPLSVLEWPEAALMLIDDAIGHGKPEAAEKGIKLAQAVGRKLKLPALVQAVAQSKRIERLKEEMAAVDSAQKLLAADPKNADASQTVGKWRCFVLGDWAGGLPLLAQCGNELLADPANREIAGAVSFDEQLLLSGLWERAGQADDRYKQAIMVRAAYWLEQARLQADLRDTKLIDQRMMALHPFLPVQRSGGAVRLGNVALSTNGAVASSSSAAGRSLYSSYGLNDGIIPAVVGQSGVAQAPWPCEWTITLDQLYRLRMIRIQFPEGANSSHVFSLQTSADGVNFSPLVEQGQGSGSQVIRFLPRAVKVIRLIGHQHTANKTFYVSELEAYTDKPGRGN